MILERIVLHNFGPYLGRHEIDLAPKPPKKPVILFGGMNGGGKTSLLTGLQLALYGRQASVWRDSETSYDAFLRKCIHRQADAGEGAGLELTFSTAVDGKDQQIHLCRYWRSTGNSIKESLDVVRDEELDAVLAEHWDEWVEEVIPARVAPLFFFDGEKIEAMAEPSKSAQILRAAVHSLLGLDIVDQLKSDLEILERRKRKELGKDDASAPAKKKEEELSQAVDAQNERIKNHTQELGAARNEVERLDKALTTVGKKLTKEGGELYERREEFEQERAKHAKKAEGFEDELRTLAMGALPLMRVQGMLQAIEADTHQHRRSFVDHALVEALTERDASMLAHLESQKASKKVLAEVRAFLQQDLEQRTTATASGEPLLDAAGLARCHALQSQVLPSDLAKTKSLLKKLDDVELAIQTIDRKLAGLPSEEQVQPLLQEREELTKARAEAQRKHDALEEALRLDRGEYEKLANRLESARKDLADTLMDDEDTQRILQHSQKARSTLAKFRQKVLESHVQRIEKLALECFVTLMRKKNLVRDLHIDPGTFTVTLRDSQGAEIFPDKISAGERQLLAIGILWGLARASGRPLPTVIDTPLGRLDSKHRSNLIDRYFPIASHQVILLSTDEEIDEDYHQQLLPRIAKSYLLEFDDDKQETSVHDGYFWEAVQ